MEDHLFGFSTITLTLLSLRLGDHTSTKERV